MATRNYKVVPIGADKKTTKQKTQELRQYLAANVGVSIADGDLTKAAVFQQHLETLDQLISDTLDELIDLDRDRT